MSLKARLLLIFLIAVMCCSHARAYDGSLVTANFSTRNGSYLVNVRTAGAESILEISELGSARPKLLKKWSAGKLSFEYLKPTADSSERLITIWGDGQGVVTVVFRLSKSPTVIFREESRFEPEFMQTAVGEVMVYYSGDDVDRNLPETAVLYLWNGNSYRRKVAVPFDQRFSALAKLDKSAARVAH